MLGCAAAFAICVTGCGIQLDATHGGSDKHAPALATCEMFTPYPNLDALGSALASEESILGIVGADIATSVLLPAGDMLFAFGDTILDSTASSEGSVRNSLVSLNGDSACLVLGSEGGAFVPDRDDGVGYWPTSMADATPPGIAVRPTVAMFLQRVRQEADGGFVNLGPALAKVVSDDASVPHVVELIEIGEDNPSRQSIGWGAASWRADDGNVYVYGTANPELPLVFGWSLHVARAEPRDVFHPSSWQYWDGQEWTRNPAASAPLIPAVGGVSQTLSVFADDASWYALSKQDDYLGSDIVAWSAPAPTGPFTASPPLAHRPSDVDSGIVRYAAVAHPGLYAEEGSVVVSISQNSTDRATLAADPTLYRPEFFRVPLPGS